MAYLLEWQIPASMATGGDVMEILPPGSMGLSSEIDHEILESAGHILAP
jgi:hypothetical protein